MPRYDYECLSCGHPFELRQTFHEAGVGACPLCSGKARRKFHAVPVIYKGSGFYTTDYGRPKPPPSDQSDHKEKETKIETNKEPKEGKDSKATVKKEPSASSEAKTGSAAKTTSDVSA